MDIKKNENGITLIALIVTIIVLLILAGISITMLAGENGILNKAANASDKTKIAQEKEELQLMITSNKLLSSDYQTLDRTALEEALRNCFGSSVTIKSNSNDYCIVQFSSGNLHYISKDGTVIAENEMIGISTEQELEEFRNAVNAGDSYKGKYVYLEDDIDLTNEQWTPIGIANGDEYNNFEGTFDGRSHEIKNITVSESVAAGLFGYVKGATIINLTVNGSISTTGNYRAGGIVSVVSSGNETTLISDCINNCTVSALNSSDTSGDTQAGGIVGNTEGSLKIEKCSNKGSIEATNHAGGIIARINGNTIISNCDNNSEVKCGGLASVGGICGSIKANVTVSILNSTNNGKISGEKGCVAGMIGNNDANSTLNIENCSNLGNITSNGSGSYVGGIVARPTGTAKIYKCINNADIDTSGNYIGGIVAYTNKYSVNIVIDQCINNGDVKLDGSTASQYPGGICGAVYGGAVVYISNCYNTGTVTTSKSISGGIVGVVNTDSGTSKSELKIFNSYNVGEIKSVNTTKDRAIIGVVKTGDSATVENCYYLRNTEHDSVGYEENATITGSAEPKNDEEMISPELVSALNKNTDVWVQDSDGTKNNHFPIFNWQ